MESEAGRLVVLSGPSGAGKTSVVRALKEDPRVEFSVSATTRGQRPGEVDGVDYWFLAREDFEARINRSEFIEWAVYNGEYYGTLRSQMDQALASGRHFVIEIEVQGTKQLRESGVPGDYVFLVPPSLDDLRERLEARAANDPDDIARRVAIAERELAEAHLYDHVVVNRSLDDAIAEVKRVIGIDGVAHA
ncbi:MAG: guanylate kinase [Planctomycetota bacterium]